MGLLRGEEIVHKKIRMPGHIPKAIKILEKIASFDEDVLEFIDLTENDLEAKKSFFPLIRRCENMEVKLNALEKFADEFNIPIDNFKNYTEFKNALYQDQQKRQIQASVQEIGMSSHQKNKVSAEYIDYGRTSQRQLLLNTHGFCIQSEKKAREICANKNSNEVKKLHSVVLYENTKV